jgi:hypothetical protein
MSGGKTAITEQLKNVLLVVLVLSTILLLYFLWNDDAGAGFRIPGNGVSRNAETIPLKAVLSPESIIVNFGAENYTSLTETARLWYGEEDGGGASFMGGLMKFLASDNMAVSVISREDFSDVMRARSIRAEFPFAIPVADFCAEFGLKHPAPLDAVEAFTCVAYSEASPESLFLCNRPGGLFFRLAVEGESGFRELIELIETFDNESYYPLRTFSGVENDTLLPLNAGNAPAELPYTRSLNPDDAGDSSRITEMTRAFFGNSFDFTRKITEGNGTTVYMYGYGEKVFVINRDGSFEYSANATESGRGGAATVFDALTSALAFAASHGERGGGRDPLPREIYLRDVTYGFAEGRKTYGFLFGVKINGYKVYYADSEPLSVEVTGQQVSYYRFDMIDGILNGANGAKPAVNAFAPFGILTEHFAYIYGALAGKGTDAPPETVPDEETMFENVAGRVSGLSSGFLRPSGDASRGGGDPQGDPGVLLPVWVLTVDGVDFYFDIYTGSPEGYME